jgi:hypothetical protein
MDSNKVGITQSNLEMAVKKGTKTGSKKRAEHSVYQPKDSWQLSCLRETHLV